MGGKGSATVASLGTNDLRHQLVGKKAKGAKAGAAAAVVRGLAAAVAAVEDVFDWEAEAELAELAEVEAAEAAEASVPSGRGGPLKTPSAVAVTPSRGAVSSWGAESSALDGSGSGSRPAARLGVSF